MRKTFYILIILLVTTLTYSVNAQETCSSPKEEIIEDLNSITKCTIKSSKRTKNKRARLISVKVSAPKKRFLKKRTAVKRNAASGVGSVASSDLESINTDNSEIAKSLELRKSVANLTNNLSAEEVRKASRFMDIQHIPVFEKCKGTKGDEAMDCFNLEMISHIQKHFTYPGEAVMKKIEGEVWVRFIIDQNGNVTNIKTLGPDDGELLELEAKRVASKLPKFTPAFDKGKAVASKYGFPINFSLNQ